MAKVNKRIIKSLSRKTKDRRHIWIIAYINYDNLPHLARQLKRLDDVEACIPTVKVLRKVSKNKAHFDYIPLLFNYGFFRIKKEKYNDTEYLQEIKQTLSCISGYVKNLAAEYTVRKGTKKDRTEFAPIATATTQGILDMVILSEDLSIHTSQDVAKMKPGDMVILQGYPFEGLIANISKIFIKKKKVEVTINVGGETTSLLKTVIVDFQNVFYTSYKHHNPDKLLSGISLDEFNSTRKIEKILFKRTGYGQENN